MLQPRTLALSALLLLPNHNVTQATRTVHSQCELPVLQEFCLEFIVLPCHYEVDDTVDNITVVSDEAQANEIDYDTPSLVRSIDYLNETWEPC